MPDAPLPKGALEDVLLRLDRAPQYPEIPPRDLDLSPHGLRWAGPTPSIQYKRFWRNGDSTLQLVRLMPGAVAPLHSHDGLELMLVLRGSFSDGRAEYLPGDVCEADQDVEHEPRTTSDEPCDCLIALEGKLLYHSPIHRVRRRIFGI